LVWGCVVVVVGRLRGFWGNWRSVCGFFSFIFTEERRSSDDVPWGIKAKVELRSPLASFVSGWVERLGRAGRAARFLLRTAGELI
jgi:hypothetical protein